MKLRFIVAACSVGITLALVSAISLLGRRLLIQSYSALEERHLRADMRRSLDLLDAEVQNLHILTRDYATWNDTYEFMNLPNPKYIAGNYGDLSTRDLSLALVVLVSARGRVRFSRSDFSGSAPSELEITNFVNTIASPRASQDASGIVMFGGSPAIVSIHPILRSNGQGPPRGTLVMVRELDYRFVARLSALAQVPLILQPLERISDPQWLHIAKESIRSRAPVIQILDEEHTTGFLVLRDLSGNPRLLLRTVHDRQIWNRGKTSIRLLLLLTLMAGTIFCILNVLLTHRYVVGRIEKMIQFTSTINTGDTLSQRIQISGSDEIAQLGKQLNRMLDDLQLSHEELRTTGMRLQFEATHDYLTGAWNRAAGLEMLDREIDRCSREHSQVAVIMLDLDHFKSINDRYGHSMGDAVLKAFTAIIIRNLRSFDFLARYGGEEFLVIAPNCFLPEARALGQRLLDRLQAVPIRVNDSVIHVSASAGITAGAAPFTSEDLIAVADQAMYRAKENGRNCACFEEMDPARPVRAQMFAVRQK